jgi:hypothetical protein
MVGVRDAVALSKVMKPKQLIATLVSGPSHPRSRCAVAWNSEARHRNDSESAIKNGAGVAQSIAGTRVEPAWSPPRR